MENRNEAEQIFEYYANAKESQVSWLWYPYLPYGKVSVIQGDPCTGKSSFVMELIALLTTGKEMPGSQQIQDPINVVYQCSEDGIADTIKPRLIRAGADLDRVVYIIDDEERLTFSDDRIEETIKQTNARLAVFDPIQSFVGDGDMTNPQTMRRVMSSLAAIADRNSCAIVLVGHLNKAPGGKALYRGLGSIDIVAAARSILMIAADEENPDLRYMYPIKHNLAPRGPAIGFSITAEGFCWLGEQNLDLGMEKAVSKKKDSKLDEAGKLLTELLKDGDRRTTEILEELRALGISKRTVQRAKREMDIEAYKQGNVWFWHLENEDDNK